MAKAKKRVATRKKSLKRGKTKPARKKAAKHTALKKAKSKVQRAGKSATKPTAPKKRNTAAGKAAKSAPRQVVGVPVETTIIDVIEQPVPGVVVVTEYESVRTATPISPGSLSKPSAGPGSEEQ